MKLKGKEKRYIFKQAMKGILPEKVLYKTKHGFGVPLALWFLQEPKLNSLMQDVLHDPRTRQRGYFRPEFFDQVSPNFTAPATPPTTAKFSGISWLSSSGTASTSKARAN